MKDLQHYRYRGARALVLLHEKYMREFLDTWKQAKAANVTLPKTDDPDYLSMEHLLHHLLRAARGYMTWMCEKLGLHDPGIEPAPPPERADTEAEQYLAHVLEKWREPLANVEEPRFGEEYPSRWKTVYCIDAMLEHAVCHPLRHTFQLRELMGNAETLK